MNAPFRTFVITGLTLALASVAACSQSPDAGADKAAKNASVRAATRYEPPAATTAGKPLLLPPAPAASR